MAGASSLLPPVEKNHSIQCEDASDFVRVADFKRKCSEMYDEVLGAHMTQADHVTYPPEIAEICNTAQTH
jgi:hypothetical protein